MSIMPRAGRRKPAPNEPGLYLSQWWPRAEIELLDELADKWGTNRSQTVKRAVEDALVSDSEE